MIDVIQCDTSLSGLGECQFDNGKLVLLSNAQIDVGEVVIYTKLKDLNFTEFLCELGQPHPETFPSVLGNLQQGLFFRVRSANR
jgi:hypothetical protein